MLLKKFFSVLTAFFIIILSVSCNHTSENSNREVVCPSSSTVISPSDTAVSHETEDNIPKVVPLHDFSFLDGKTGVFPDAEEDGSWYAGKVVRDIETGSVEHVWERDAVTLNLLEKYGAYYRCNEQENVCYLTFDCGYELKTDIFPDGTTGVILDILKNKNVKAVFFVTASYIEENPQIIRRMFDEGHIIGNHTAHHKNMTTLSNDEFVSEIIENQNMLKMICPDAPDMIYYRPPEGACDERTLCLAKEMGMHTVLWSATHYDYDRDNMPSEEEALFKTESRLHQGCIYLLHANSDVNPLILDELIDYIFSQQFEIRILGE